MAQDAVIRLLLVEDQLEDAEQLISMLRNGGMAIRPQRPESMDELDSVLATASVIKRKSVTFLRTSFISRSGSVVG